MSTLIKAFRLLFTQGPGAFFEKLRSELFMFARRSPKLQPVFANREWKGTEKKLKASNPDNYNQAWGDARLELYKKWGGLPCPKREVERLASLHNKHKGERIFIMGNGPSLNDTPLEKLDGEFTFGLNRIYLLFDRLTWRPSFYTCIDWRVTPDNAGDINKLEGMTFFFPQQYSGLLRTGEDVFWFQEKYLPQDKELPIEERFSYDISKNVRFGNTVTVTAIQIAYFMGFDPIYLIGVDASYKVSSTVEQTGKDFFGVGILQDLQSTKDDDQNHFDPRYFGKDKRWTSPYVPAMLEGFKDCREAIEARNRRIFNATVGGELEVFDRVDFNSLF